MNYKEKVIALLNSQELSKEQKEKLEEIFPELKDDDERIRKEIIAFLKENLETGRADETWSLSGLERWVAWLEAQGEKKLEVKYVYTKFRVGDVIVEIKPNGYCPPVTVKYVGEGAYSCRSVDGKRFLSFPITMQDEYKLVEQKSANKVEPKFKVGDTVKDPYGDLYHITEIIDDSYKTYDGRFILFKNQEVYTLSNFTTWSEEDEEMYKKVETAIASYYAPFSRDAEEMSEWFKNIKDRVQPKQEWNKDNEIFYNRTIGLLKQYTNSDSEVEKQSALSCVNWLKSAIKHERIIKYKIGDRVRFFPHGEVFTISDIDEVNESYISTFGGSISFYEELISAKGSLNKDDIKCGDYLTTKNGTVIKVHDVDESERVHYFYYAYQMTEDGGDISNNFMQYCAILCDCSRATQEDIDFLEKWVAHKKYVWVENDVSPDDEEDD
jgi:hypothetical protein